MAAMAARCLLFVVVILVLSDQTTAADSIKTRLFHNIAVPDSGGPVRVGEAWLAKSLISCISACLDKFSPCPSAMYNNETRLCTPGSWLEPNQIPPSSTEGKLYISYNCGPFPQFQVLVYANGATTACLALIQENKMYLDADLHCKSLGSELATAKTAGKMELLGNVAVDRTYIGLDDIQEEGKYYVWRADGTIFDMADQDIVFADKEPNNYGGKEDCVHIERGDKAYDRSCEYNFDFFL